MDRGRGKIDAEGVPAPSTVSRYINPQVRPDIEDIRQLRVLLDDVHGLGGEVPYDGLPALPGIVGPEQKGAKIVLPESGLGHIDPTQLVPGGDNPAHPFPGNPLAYLLPVLSLITGEPHRATFRPHIDEPLLEPRLGDHGNGPEWHYRPRAPSGIRQVRTDGNPIVSPVGGFQQAIATDVQGERVIVGDDEGGVPPGTPFFPLGLPPPPGLPFASPDSGPDTLGRTGEDRILGDVHPAHGSVLVLVVDKRAVRGIQVGVEGIPARPLIKVHVLPRVPDGVLDGDVAGSIQGGVVLGPPENPIGFGQVQ